MVIKRVLAFPVWPVLLGAVMVWDDSVGNLSIRSWGLLCAVVWLTIDIGVLVYDSKSGWPQRCRYAILCGVFGFFSFVMTIAMHRMLSSKLHQVRDESWLHLKAEMYMPPDENAYASQATITNGGSTRIRRKAIECFANVIVNMRGAGIGGLGEIVPPNGTALMVPFPGGDPSKLLDDIPIEPGGDAETDDCLSLISISGSPIACAGGEVRFFYSLISTRTLSSTKSFALWPKEEWESPLGGCRNRTSGPSTVHIRFSGGLVLSELLVGGNDDGSDLQH